MEKFFRKYFWTIIVVIAALGLAGAAAYFSISGLSKLFAGSAMQVIIMASFIEFAKLVTTAALHRYWKGINWILKYVLALMVVAIMFITSSGIYGFLADAYSSTSSQLEKIQGQIELVEKQQEQKKEQIVGVEEIKKTKSERINSLIQLRIQQEARIDSLYSKGRVSSAKNTQILIDQSTIEIQKLQVDLDSLGAKINRINEGIGEMDIEILELENSDIATEIGPLKYMSKVLNRPMENIINWFILMLIFVFDPLAVLLVIFANTIYDRSIESYNKKYHPNTESPKIPNSPEKEAKKLSTPEIEPEAETEIEPEAETEIEPEAETEIELEAETEIEPEIEPEAKTEVEPERYDKVVEAINNIDSNVLNFSYDFPEEKGEEVVEYVESESGEFKKSSEVRESLASLINGIDSNPVYLQLLDVLFLNGNRNIGDIIPPYKVLVKNISDKGIICDDKVIKNFLTICNLLDITNMSDKNNVKITKSYSTSRDIISLVSK